jgi:hypothetical protein
VTAITARATKKGGPRAARRQSAEIASGCAFVAGEARLILFVKVIGHFGRLLDKQSRKERG